MKRLFAALLLLCLPGDFAAADLVIPDVAYPKLAVTGSTAADFVPAGWKLEYSSTGDLNGDSAADLLLLLRMNDPKNVIANKEGLGEDPFDTNPRILAVAFAEKAGGYRLALENHTLIARRTVPTQSDPITDASDIAIERGALKVHLDFFLSAGGWGMFNCTYRFRYQNGRFELIGFDKVSTQRNTGEIEIVSINYSTGKVEIGTGTIESDETKRTVKKLEKKRKALTIEAIGDGLEFDPMPAP